MCTPVQINTGYARAPCCISNHVANIKYIPGLREARKVFNKVQVLNNPVVWGTTQSGPNWSKHYGTYLWESFSRKRSGMKDINPRHYITIPLLLGEVKCFGAGTENSVQKRNPRKQKLLPQRKEGVPHDSYNRKKKVVWISMCRDRLSRHELATCKRKEYKSEITQILVSALQETQTPCETFIRASEHRDCCSEPSCFCRLNAAKTINN